MEVPDWKAYVRETQSLREYRNVIVHDVKIGQGMEPGSTLVPRKERIQDYRTWPAVFAALQDPNKRNDFIDMNEQMRLDIGQLEVNLNRLWNKVINDLSNLLFDARNQALLRKCSINFG